MDEAIGAIPADRDNQPIIPDSSSGFRRVSGEANMSEGAGTQGGSDE